MKLRYAPTSPYVRKVMVTAMETGLVDRIEKVPSSVMPDQAQRRGRAGESAGEDSRPHHR